MLEHNNDTPEPVANAYDASNDVQTSHDVCLISMPYPVIDQPSMALGILKSALTRKGLSAKTFYPCLEFAEEIGLDVFGFIADSKQEFLVGEWTFAGAAFPDFRPDHEAYLDLVLSAAVSTGLLERSGFRADPRAALWKARDAATAFTDRVAREVLLHKPKIVGCTSTFFQHCASLAVLRRIREIDSSVVTVMGGANCEGPMGVATKKNFDWVDFVVSGEADVVFPNLCLKILENSQFTVEPAQASLGVIGKDNCHNFDNGEEVPRSSVFHMDSVPSPNYDDYFETLIDSPLSKYVSPGLPIETSRGCWWGAKKHCTFCGLNGGNMAFRSKSPDRVLEELEQLSSAHGIRRFNVVDNILDLKYLHDLLPVLAKNKPYVLFFETKANLRREQLKLIASAGIRRLQPGIESMHDDILRLIQKGTTGLQNVQLLKWAREYGIFITWNFLWDVPGEEDDWYGEMADWLPTIMHLQPPGIDRIQFHRFSPYHTDAKDFDLSLEPYPAYRYVYPVPEIDLSELAYYFDDINRAPARTALDQRPGLKRVIKIIAQWNQLWGFVNGSKASDKLTLMMSETEAGELKVMDTRPCATKSAHLLKGLDAHVYRLCDSIKTISSLTSKLAKDQIAVKEEEVLSVLQRLEKEKLVLNVNGRYLALAVRQMTEIPNAPDDFPGGYTDLESWYDDCSQVQANN